MLHIRGWSCFGAMTARLFPERLAPGAFNGVADRLRPLDRRYCIDGCPEDAAAIESLAAQLDVPMSTLAAPTSCPGRVGCGCAPRSPGGRCWPMTCAPSIDEEDNPSSHLSRRRRITTPAAPGIANNPVGLAHRRARRTGPGGRGLSLAAPQPRRVLPQLGELDLAHEHRDRGRASVNSLANDSYGRMTKECLARLATVTERAARGSGG